MPHRFIFIAALIAGASYYGVDHVMLPGVFQTIWKGAGVGLLALWAASAARGRDGWLLAGVMALGATGDVSLEVAGLTIGAVAFLAGHVVAIVLYRCHPRTPRSVSDTVVAGGLLASIPAVSWLLTHDAGVALYATGLGGMAASAWLSRFSRAQVGLGAMLFVVSDWLIFARGGVLAGSAVPGLLVWPTYFAGQALIARGVGKALHRGLENEHEGLHDRL